MVERFFGQNDKDLKIKWKKLFSRLIAQCCFCFSIKWRCNIETKRDQKITLKKTSLNKFSDWKRFPFISNTAQCIIYFAVEIIQNQLQNKEWREKKMCSVQITFFQFPIHNRLLYIDLQLVTKKDEIYKKKKELLFTGAFQSCYISKKKYFCQLSRNFIWLASMIRLIIYGTWISFTFIHFIRLYDRRASYYTVSSSRHCWMLYS